MVKTAGQKHINRVNSSALSGPLGRKAWDEAIVLDSCFVFTSDCICHSYWTVWHQGCETGEGFHQGMFEVGGREDLTTNSLDP